LTLTTAQTLLSLDERGIAEILPTAPQEIERTETSFFAPKEEVVKLRLALTVEARQSPRRARPSALSVHRQFEVE
jgi:hypothetical protein